MRQLHPDLELLSEELIPITTDRMFDGATTIDDDDLKQFEAYSEETLSSKYRAQSENIKASRPKQHTRPGAEQVTDELRELQMLMESRPGGKTSLLVEQMSSNFFAVHGDHTDNGMPIFAGDPHIINALPSIWILFNLRLEDGSGAMSGAQMHGIPFIGVGRT